ncbi:MAG: hypothetical protein KGM24_07205 [Elusimicrobia bacterium]|nr:hypothetical protein [Elusimicrobiota bacterium]
MTREKEHARAASPDKPSYKRQQYWVDAPLQLQMVGFALVLVSSSLLLTSFAVLRGVADASARSQQIFHSLEWFRGALRAPLLLSAGISLLAGGIVTLFWSHRFAGPLRVLAAGIARVRHGNLALPVRVRASDAHQDLAREFQEMQDELRRMIETDRAHVAAAAARVESARKSLEEGRPADDELALALKELRQACSRYHL